MCGENQCGDHFSIGMQLEKDEVGCVQYFAGNHILTDTMYYMGTTLLFAAAFASTLHVRAMTEEKFNTWSGVRSGNAPVKLVSARSRIECASRCITEPICLGYNYDVLDEQCGLLSAPHGEIPQDGWIFGYKLHLDNGELKNC